jgi:TetR/AcrR family transcriptional regulator, lmrAB and yxaGH operons repressor
MARPVTVPADQVSLRMREAFRRKGFDGATLAELAEASGLAKAGLYHRFPGGKLAMAEAVLDDIREWMAEHVIRPLHAPGDARRKLQNMTAALMAFYDAGSSPCLLGTFSIGEALSHFQPRLSESMKNLQGAIARILEQRGVSRARAALAAEKALISIQGSLVVSRIQGDNGPFIRTMKELPHQLLAEK